MRAFGMLKGPFELLDEIGVGEVLRSLRGYSNGQSRMYLTLALEKLADSGFGSEPGDGRFYLGSQGCEENEALLEAIGFEALPQDSSSKSLIRDRLVFILLRESIRILDDENSSLGRSVLGRNLDLASVYGIGFPAYRGGAIYFSEELGLRRVYNTLMRFSDLYGSRFQPPGGLRVKALSGRSLYQP